MNLADNSKEHGVSEASESHQPENAAVSQPQRSMAVLLTAVCGGMLAWNHYEGLHNGSVYLWPLFIGPLGFLLGLGAIVDPRILWSIGPKGQSFPTRIKVIGGLLAVAGLLFSAYLALGVYRLQEPQTSTQIENATGTDTSK